MLIIYPEEDFLPDGVNNIYVIRKSLRYFSITDIDVSQLANRKKLDT